MRGSTSFVIAHRLSTIKNAGMILIMNDGDIIEKGSHKDLLKQNGFYANLYNLQFKYRIIEEDLTSLDAFGNREFIGIIRDISPVT